MSGFDSTTTELLADIKRKSFVPTSQITFSDSDILAMADEELQTGIVPFLMAVREEYLVDFFDQLVTTTQAEYALPRRTIGAKLRAVTVLINPNNQDQPNERKLPEINAEDAVFNNNFNNFLSLQAFYLRNNVVVLSPGASSFAGQTLRMYYFKRPSKLILTSACSKITSITNTTCIVNLVPTNFGTGGVISITADVVKSTDPYQITSMDLSLTIDPSTNTVTFPSDIASMGINIGDYICLAGESPIPLIPLEVFSLLAQRVAVKILQALGDNANYNVASQRLQEMEHNVRGLISNRVEGSNRKVVNQYTTFNVNPYRRF